MFDPTRTRTPDYNDPNPARNVPQFGTSTGPSSPPLTQGIQKAEKQIYANMGMEAPKAPEDRVDPNKLALKETERKMSAIRSVLGGKKAEIESFLSTDGKDLLDPVMGEPGIKWDDETGAFVDTENSQIDASLRTLEKQASKRSGFFGGGDPTDEALSAQKQMSEARKLATLKKQRYRRLLEEERQAATVMDQLKIEKGQISSQMIGLSSPAEQAPNQKFAQSFQPEIQQEPAKPELGSEEWYQAIEAHGGVVGGGRGKESATPGESVVYRSPDEVPAPAKGVHRFSEGQKDGTVKVLDVPLSEAAPMVGQSIDDIRKKREKLQQRIDKAPEKATGRAALESKSAELESQESDMIGSFAQSGAESGSKFILGERIKEMEAQNAKPLQIANTIKESRAGVEKALENKNLRPEHRDFLSDQLKYLSAAQSEQESRLTAKQKKELNPGVIDRIKTIFQSGASGASSYAYSGVAGAARAADVGSQWLDDKFFGDSKKQGEGMFPSVARLAAELSQDRASFGVGEVEAGRMENQVSEVLLGQMPVQIALLANTGRTKAAEGLSKILSWTGTMKRTVGNTMMGGALFSEQISDAEQTMGQKFDEMAPEDRSDVAKAAFASASVNFAIERAGLMVVGASVIGKANKAVKTDFVIDRLTKGSLWKKAVAGFIAEGETEATQQYVTSKMAQFFYDADRDLWDAEAIDERFKMFVIGGIAGGMTKPLLESFGKASRDLGKEIREAESFEPIGATKLKAEFEKSQKELAEVIKNGPLTFTGKADGSTPVFKDDGSFNIDETKAPETSESNSLSIGGDVNSEVDKPQPVEAQAETDPEDVMPETPVKVFSGKGTREDGKTTTFSVTGTSKADFIRQAKEQGIEIEAKTIREKAAATTPEPKAPNKQTNDRSKGNQRVESTGKASVPDVDPRSNGKLADPKVGRSAGDAVSGTELKPPPPLSQIEATAKTEKAKQNAREMHRNKALAYTQNVGADTAPDQVTKDHADIRAAVEVAKAYKTKPETIRPVADVIRGVQRFAEKQGQSVTVEVLDGKAFDSEASKLGAEGRAAVNVSTDGGTRLLINKDFKHKGDESVVATITHEALHTAGRSVDDFVKGEWAKLTPAQRKAAAKEYGEGLDGMSDAELADSFQARQEWFAFQGFRVLKGEISKKELSQKYGVSFAKKVGDFVDSIRNYLKQWVGSKDLSTEQLDAKIAEIIGDYVGGSYEQAVVKESLTPEGGEKASTGASQDGGSTPPASTNLPSYEEAIAARDKSAKDAKDGEIYTVQVRDRGTMYAVRDAESNPKSGFGDSLWATFEEAEAESKRMIEAREDARKMKERRKQQEAQEAEEKAEREDLDGFADEMTDMQRGRAIKTLTEAGNLIRYKGKVMNRRDYIRALVSDGFEVTEIGGERVMQDPGKDTFKDGFTKTALDYAEYLISKKEPARQEVSEKGQGASATPDVADATPEGAQEKPTETKEEAEPETQEQRARPAPKSEPKADSAAPPANKIEDFGEKIGGARKDYAATLSEAEKADIATVPLAKAWPEPNYKKLVEQGADPFIVGFVRAARDEVPAKPRKGYKVARYVQQVQTLRDVAKQLLNGEISAESIKSLLQTKEYQNFARNVGGRAELYAEVGHDNSLKGVSFGKQHFSFYRGENDVTKWMITKKGKSTAFGNWPTELSVGNTREEALKQFKKKLEAKPTEKGKKPIKFQLYKYTSGKSDKAGVYIGKKIGTTTVDLFRFDTPQEARAYLEENYDDVVARLEAFKKIGKERRDKNAPRVGDDYREGKDVTPEQFQEAFGFRGVEFGNYVEQSRRQADLNRAYDSLMDLAAILNIPTQAISLDGKLGLAFGARGHGGKDAPAAHYEPSKIVINLTKRSGPGSLAHEWWHAVDNYFGKAGDFVTESPAARRAGQGKEFVNNLGMRDEMVTAFGKIVNAVAETQLPDRSAELDKRKSKKYYSEMLEMTARSFENYVIERMAGMNAQNDYLANINDLSSFAESMVGAFLDGKTAEDLYPYLTQDEVESVAQAFDDFFSTVKTKQTDTGVALFAPYIPEADSGQMTFEDMGTEPNQQGLAAPRISQATKKLAALTDNPTSYQYEDFNTAEIRLREVAESEKIQLLNPKNPPARFTEALEALGVRSQFYRSKRANEEDPGFVASEVSGLVDVIFINAESSNTAIGWTLAHEATHVSENTENYAVFKDKVLGLLSRKERNSINMILKNGGYNPLQFDAEIVAYLAADAIHPEEGTALAGLENWEEITQAVSDFFNEATPFKPKSKFDNTDDALLAPRIVQPESEFYSQLEQVIDSKVQGKSASAAQLMGMIQKSGVKPEEIKWSGIQQWLSDNKDAKGNVPKSELMAYLRDAGQVKFEEVVKGKMPTLDKIAKDLGFGGWTSRLTDEQKKQIDAKAKTYTHLGDNTQYSNYVLPNGENYREVVLTMPVGRTSSLGIGSTKSGYWHVTDGEGNKFGKGFDTEQEAISHKNWLQSNPQSLPPKLQKATKTVYTSSHFNDIPNYVAHMRLNERTDAAGNEGLFIEEIQSDRHQAGRDKGYVRPDRTSKLKEKYPSLPDNTGSWSYNILNEAGVSAEEILEWQTDSPLSGAVPDAPYRKDWPLAMFKRALRDAVVSGKDWIGWTVGETQADRYDLSKQVSEIRYRKSDNMLQAWKQDLGSTEYQEPEIEQSVEPENLANMIGKEAARKALEGEPDSQGWVSLKGQDLKVGGEGMKDFYDNMLPKFVQKYVKKWGGKVESGKLVGSKETTGLEWDGRKWVDPVTPIHRVTITDAMRESVSEGQPLFAPRIVKGTPEQEAITKRVYTTMEETRKPGERIADWVKRKKEDWKYRQLHATVDNLTGIEMAEDRTLGSGMARNLDATTSALKKAHLSRYGEVFANAWIHDGQYQANDDGSHSIIKDAPSFINITQRLDTPEGSLMRKWESYLGAVRSNELLKEGRERNYGFDREGYEKAVAAGEDVSVDDFIDKDRAQAEIDAHLAYAEEHPFFEEMREQYVEWWKNMLDFAQAKGVINPESRAKWNEESYVPLNRVYEDPETMMKEIKGPDAPKTSKDAAKLIKRLRGGTGQVAILENIVLNLNTMMQEALTNDAKLQLVTNAGDNSIYLEKAKHVPTPFKVAKEEVIETLAHQRYVELMATGQLPPNTHGDLAAFVRMAKSRANAGNYDLIGLSDETDMQRQVTFWRMKQPQGKDIMTVMVDGKPQYWKVKNKMLMESIEALGADNWTGMTRAFLDATGIPASKRLLTSAITLEPGFIVANSVRDSSIAWATNKEIAAPGIQAMVEAAKTLTGKNDIAAELKGSGFGGVEWGGLRGRNPMPKNIRKHVLRMEKSERQGFLKSLVKSPSEALIAYEKVVGASESANRLALARQLMKNGASVNEAAYQAIDMMNFRAHGNGEIMRALIHTTPFLNSSMQGLYRTIRQSGGSKFYKTREGRAKAAVFATRGAIMAGASMALLAMNWDDDEYWKLQEWDRNSYWHFFPGTDRHIRIPKPFEVGFIFATLPEKFWSGLREKEPENRDIWGTVLALAGSNLIASPIPQGAKQWLEVWANTNTFTGMPILNQGDERKAPEAQYDIYTSEAMIEAANAMPGLAPDWARSPKQLEHVVKGLTGTLGAYVIDSADMMVRRANSERYPNAPKTHWRDLPMLRNVIGRYWRSPKERTSSFVGDFYDLYRETEEVMSQIEHQAERGDRDRAMEIREEKADVVVRKPLMDKTRYQMSELNKQKRLVYQSPTMPPDMKQRRLNELAERRNAIAERTVKSLFPQPEKPFVPFTE